jgi:hypothetical protein
MGERLAKWARLCRSKSSPRWTTLPRRWAAEFAQEIGAQEAPAAERVRIVMRQIALTHPSAERANLIAIAQALAEVVMALSSWN